MVNEIQTKACSKCNQVKELTYSRRDSGDVHPVDVVRCACEGPARRLHRKKWYASTIQRPDSDTRVTQRVKLRDAVLDAYGSQCACCEESSRSSWLSTTSLVTAPSTARSLVTRRFRLPETERVPERQVPAAVPQLQYG